jgi:hypothetical protein
MAAVLAVGGHYLFATPLTLPRQSSSSRLIGLAVLVTAGIVTYTAAGQALGAFDIRQAAEMVSRRFLRGRRRSAMCARPTDP